MSRISFVRPSRVVGLLCALALLAGCGDDGPSGPQSPYDADTRPENVTYASHLVELGVVIGEMVRTDTGMYYRDLEEGEGEVAAGGNFVSAGYALWLPEGEEEPLQEGDVDFTIEEQPSFVGVIPGWDEGFKGMREGGRRLLVIPWWLAYGASGQGPIPPYAPLVFEVELLEIF